MANNNDVDTERQRVAYFVVNATCPPSLTIHDRRKIAFLRASKGESLDSLLALNGHTKWYQVTGNKVTTLYLGSNLNPTSNSWKLSSDIGKMTGLIHLYLYKCWSIPKEMAKLESLKRLGLIYFDNDRLQSCLKWKGHL
eukprot:CAMPEP_0170981876 /NCGR_PEP_ID=MMETSP0736-20130129/3269_1 /TAXON_ID=186038 /ORGANISM="Fragilariopsis kerguelensis, Strain L26-C5" /LENGTH=138 /DNA_ID=CAMNT_0011404947 /DNA_START=468 /DNA_END=884 /DNA_ORIENTATION=+